MISRYFAFATENRVPANPSSRFLMKDRDSKDSPYDSPPSYSDSVAPPSFPHTFTRTRSNLISTVLAEHIHPHIYRSALNGLSQSTLLLVPSNVSTLHPAPPVPVDPGSYSNPFQNHTHSNTFINESIVGFLSAENLSLDRLHGEANTLEFWCQDRVIRELQTQLQADLSDGGYRVIWESGGQAMIRLMGSKAEWKLVSEPVVDEGQVRVVVEMREVSLRIENVMGLYETRRGKALMVRTEFEGGWLMSPENKRISHCIKHPSNRLRLARR